MKKMGNAAWAAALRSAALRSGALRSAALAMVLSGALTGLAAQPLQAGSPLKGIDVKLGKTARAAGAHHGVTPHDGVTQRVVAPGKGHGGLIGAAKVKSHSNTNNN